MLRKIMSSFPGAFLIIGEITFAFSNTCRMAGRKSNPNAADLAALFIIVVIMVPRLGGYSLAYLYTCSRYIDCPTLGMITTTAVAIILFILKRR